MRPLVTSTKGVTIWRGKGFDEYLKNYPDTELSDNAQYWIGESLYIQRKFSEAIQGFDKVLAKYPKGDKAPAAALKKGYSLLEIKNNDAGIRELRQLIQKYPNSDSAQLAKDRLSAMGVAISDRSTASRRSRNTLAFADVPSARLSAASSFFGTAQQLSPALGVVLATAALEAGAGVAGRHGAVGLADFAAAFLVAGGVIAVSAPFFARLPPEAGAAVSGHGTTASR